MVVSVVDEFVGILKKNIEDFEFRPVIKEVGTVVSVNDGVVKAIGLDKVFMGEFVEFEGGVRGMALNLNSDSVDIVIFDEDSKVHEGMIVKRLNTTVSVPVGKGLLGRVVNALGEPIDGRGAIDSEDNYPIEKSAPGILDRKSVHEPMQTGIKSIDALIPIGRGQRELIIGDRQTGKTAIAIDAILNQAKINENVPEAERVYSVYVAIGQKNSTIAKIAKELEEAGALKYTIIVSASCSDPASLQFLAPYAGCAIAEYFRDNSMHSLIVYDDLSKHAVAYRQISLLLRRPPAREAFPGDVFYLHSRLLERAAKLSDEKGSGSMTALPIIETQAGDISAYVPTNVISITDGQIFLESDLFNQGFRPAINIGLSVSRVGSAAQTKAIKQVSGSLKQKLAQYRELEAFSKFGSDLDATTLATLDEGRKISQIMVQEQYGPYGLAEQVISLFLVSHGFYKEFKVESVRQIEKRVLEIFRNEYNSVMDKIVEEKMISSELETELMGILETIKAGLSEFK